MKKQLFLLLVSFLFLTSGNAVASTISSHLIDPPETYYPEILSNTNGVYSYDAASDLFSSSATPIQITFDGTNGIFIYDGASDPASFSVNFYYAPKKGFIGGIPGNDLEIYGSFSYKGSDYDGLLLAGEVTDFGYQDAGLTKSMFDFTFNATGGLLFDEGLFPESGYDFMFTNSNLKNFWYNHSGSQTIHVTSAAVPIPSAFILLGSGLIGFMRLRKKFEKR